MPDTWDALVDTALLGPLVDFFGYTLTYTFKAGGTFTPTGVFDREFLSLAVMGEGPFASQGAINLGAPGSISTRKPVVGVQISQFPKYPQQGDRLSVQPNEGPLLNFVVREVQPDGHGHALLTLKLDT